MGVIVSPTTKQEGTKPYVANWEIRGLRGFRVRPRATVYLTDAEAQPLLASKTVKPLGHEPGKVVFPLAVPIGNQVEAAQRQAQALEDLSATPEAEAQAQEEGQRLQEQQAKKDEAKKGGEGQEGVTGQDLGAVGRGTSSADTPHANRGETDTTRTGETAADNTPAETGEGEGATAKSGQDQNAGVANSQSRNRPLPEDFPARDLLVGDYRTVEDLAAASDDELLSRKGIGPGKLAQIREAQAEALKS